MPKGNFNETNNLITSVQVPKKRSLFLTLFLFFVGIIFFALCAVTITAIVYPALIPLTLFLASYGIALGELGLIISASISTALAIGFFFSAGYRFVKGHGPIVPSSVSSNSAHENEVETMQRSIIEQADVPSAERAAHFTATQQGAIPMPCSSNTVEKKDYTAIDEPKTSTESTSLSDAHFSTPSSSPLTSPIMFHSLPNRSLSMNNLLETSDNHEDKKDKNILSTEDQQASRSLPSYGNG